MSKHHELNHAGFGPSRERRERAGAWREFRSDLFDGLLMAVFCALVIYACSLAGWQNG